MGTLCKEDQAWDSWTPVKALRQEQMENYKCSASVPGNVYSLGLGSINKQFSEKPAAAGKVTGNPAVFCLSAHTGKQRGMGNRELQMKH